MSPPIALLVGPLLYQETKWQALSSLATLKEYRTGTREGFIKALREGEFGDISLIYRSNESTMVTGLFDAEIIALLPPSAKFICHVGAGYDNIDVEACTKRGISVANTPNINIYAVADLTIYLMIGALRHITSAERALVHGKWRGQFSLGHDPQGKTLGIIGIGGIGRQVALRALSFGMKIQYHNRHPLSLSLLSAFPSLDSPSVTYTSSLNELLSTSDVISLNLGLTNENKHMLSTPQFNIMKPGVVIVNTARGALIDEDALIKALEEGKVECVGLDVFETEPQVDERLLENERILLTPHIAAATVETMANMESAVLDNLKSALVEGKLLTQVQEQLK